MKFRLEIDLGDVPEVDRRARVARLLEDTARRVMTGHHFGGFHFGREDSTPGGFAFWTRQPERDEGGRLWTGLQ